MADEIRDGRQGVFWVEDLIRDEDNLTALEAWTYTCLCSRADKRGQLFPSYNRLARDTKLGRRTVVDQVKTLVAKGYVLKEERIATGPKGGQKSNLYTVLPIDRGAGDAPPQCRTCTPPVQELHPKEDPGKEVPTEGTTTAIEDCFALISEMPLTAQHEAVLRFVWNIKSHDQRTWKIEPKPDADWVVEFVGRHPQTELGELMQCRDFHSTKQCRVDKGTWKNRFAQWMKRAVKFAEEDRSNGKHGRRVHSTRHSNTGALADRRKKQFDPEAALR